MSGDNQIYALAYALVDGALLCEETSLSVQRQSGSSPVVTVHKGYAGESPGAGMLTCDIENVIPASGFEFDAGGHISNLKEVELGILMGGKVCVAKGFIYEDDFKHAANSPATYSFKFRGKLAEFQ